MSLLSRLAGPGFIGLVVAAGAWRTLSAGGPPAVAFDEIMTVRSALDAMSSSTDEEEDQEVVEGDREDEDEAPEVAQAGGEEGAIEEAAEPGAAAEAGAPAAEAGR